MDPQLRGLFRITEAGFRNNTEKTVTALRVAWAVTTASERTLQNTDSILVQGETPLFDVSSACQ